MRRVPRGGAVHGERPAVSLALQGRHGLMILLWQRLVVLEHQVGAGQGRIGVIGQLDSPTSSLLRSQDGRCWQRASIPCLQGLGKGPNSAGV